MYHLPDYQRYVIEYIENGGFDPKGWDTEKAASELKSMLAGGSPDYMDADEFTEIMERCAL